MKLRAYEKQLILNNAKTVDNSTYREETKFVRVSTPEETTNCICNFCIWPGITCWPDFKTPRKASECLSFTEAETFEF